MLVQLCQPHIRRLLSSTSSSSSSHNFDLIVIGGGSGGLSCSKRAADLGARVALVDAVAPSPRGSTWGIGGTCANVGCIPKKLMHQAALVGKEMKTAGAYGWRGIDEARFKHEWDVLVKSVNDRIKANNWIYRVQLNQKGIKYYNAFAEFVDEKSVLVTGVDKKQTKNVLSAPNIVISTGLRPNYPNIEGSELGITSDDLFHLSKVPGKTLVVGAGYVALECAGLLAGLQQEVEVVVRSTPLKGFDRDCVGFVMANLKANGVKVREGVEVERVERSGEKKRVHFTRDAESEEYDTIIWATGRSPRLESLNLNRLGVEVDGRSGKIVADGEDRTKIGSIFAIGDIVEGREELTPLAIQSGKLLADRLFSDSTQTVRFDGIATTVFTPLELSSVGLTEAEAVRKFGDEAIEVFHSHFTPFEYVVPQNKDSEFCYVKAVCEREEPRKVLGLHFVGPNAAEVMQGYAVAFRAGISFSDLELTVAIHPCSSEEFVKLNVTKRSGKDPRTQGCCG